MKIGYQGIEGSHSEEAAKTFARELGLKKVQLIPLISSLSVVEKLEKGEVDYGVVAVRNTLGGEVIETREALRNKDPQVLRQRSFAIHHCLFVLDSSVRLGDILAVASHIQALVQCQGNIKGHLGGVELIDIEDTALGALHLAQGKHEPTTAVLCKKTAGEKYGLHLLLENIEDSEDNRTDFILFNLKNR